MIAPRRDAVLDMKASRYGTILDVIAPRHHAILDVIVPRRDSHRRDTVKSSSHSMELCMLSL